MPAPRTLRRHAPASKTLIAGFALACALAGSPASALIRSGAQQSLRGSVENQGPRGVAPTEGAE